MTEREKVYWLGAIDSLTTHYSQYGLEEIPDSIGMGGNSSCPLCIVSSLFKASSQETCENCLWLKFQKISCNNARYWLDTTLERLYRLNIWKYKIRRDCKMKACEITRKDIFDFYQNLITIVEDEDAELYKREIRYIESWLKSIGIKIRESA